jgi:hypothetical protein
LNDWKEKTLLPLDEWREKQNAILMREEYKSNGSKGPAERKQEIVSSQRLEESLQEGSKITTALREAQQSPHNTRNAVK